MYRVRVFMKFHVHIFDGQSHYLIYFGAASSACFPAAVKEYVVLDF